MVRLQKLVCFSHCASCLGEMFALGFDKFLSSIEYLLYKASNKGSARKPDIYILYCDGVIAFREMSLA